jgi:hypothetical protein
MAMRLFHNNPSTPVNVEGLSDFTDYAPFYTDSMEVAKAYYLGKLEELEEKLGSLTIEEHPVQITRLARQIMSVRSILKTLAK